MPRRILRVKHIVRFLFFVLLGLWLWQIAHDFVWFTMAGSYFLYGLYRVIRYDP